MSLRNLFLVLIICFLNCENKINESFYLAKELFNNFESILSSEEYSKTIYFYKDSNSLWRDKQDSLVSIKIPYKEHFFNFSESFLKNNNENSSTSLSRYISEYKQGIKVKEFYELDLVLINTIEYKKSIYIVDFNIKGEIIKAEFYDSKGKLIFQSNKEIF
ncbi:MAG: hypothetical protein CMC79_01780 [Flavobacteriaceae bacterium]|nr:hypothetical protein [Flavobacteriaceae bacterium]|tara:strand:- start:11966 stop:12448 length:483 start_codon:yes stop_codon:yes gene_type:complete